MEEQYPNIKGRGAAHSPLNRFERIEYVPTEEEIDTGPKPETLFFKDTSRSIIAKNESPDVGFNKSINPYRGCEHGCIYCYARPTHEYLGLSAGLDFETNIFVKEDAPQLLRKELSSPKWLPEPISISGITDPYQPAERTFKLTRQCLGVLAEFRNPVGIVTKNSLVTRDIDLLQELTSYNAAIVAISVTTLDPKLSRLMEPRAPQPDVRLKAMEKLARGGVPVIVMVAPIVPGLTDHEIPSILKSAADAGARSAGYIMLRLPYGVSELFLSWLQRHYPGKKDKVTHRLESVRGGKLNSAVYHDRMKGSGVFAEGISDLFEMSRKKYGLTTETIELDASSFRRPGDTDQLNLFK